MSYGSRFLATGAVIAISGSLLVATVGAALAQAETGSAANAAPSGRTGALIMGQGDGQSVAGWSQLGRLQATNADGSGYGEMRHLQAVGDRLVVIGSALEPNEGPSHDIVYHSVDGITWLPADVKASKPRFTDLVTDGEDLVLAGSERVNGTRKARLWTSSDGIAWKRVAAPSRLKRIDQIVSAGTSDTPLTVRGGRNLWARPDGGAWSFVTKLIDMPIVHGPGGFLASQFPNGILLHWGNDLASISEVALPKAMGQDKDLLADAQLFALEDQWLLVPHVLTNPDTVYASPDGLTWTRIPRPPGIVAGAVRWMTDLGDEVQAFGAVDGDRGDAGGIWTFVPGEPVLDAATLARSDEFIDTPVAFGGGYAASGLKMGRAWELTSWARSAGSNQ